MAMMMRIFSDREAAFAAIVRRADRETTTPERWLALVIERIKGPHGRMPNGWWPKITIKYNRKHNQNVTSTTMKNKHTQCKNQQQPTQSGSGQVAEERECPLPATITNSQLYTNIKNLLASNIELALNHQTDRKRTRKVYSQEVNYQVIRIELEKKVNILAE